LEKPTFTGSPTLDERFGFKPTTVVDVTPPEPDPSEPPSDPDVWESPSGYLRCARHQVFALELIRRDGVLTVIPYSAIDSGDGRFNGDRFQFRFFRGDAAFEATLEGTITHLQRVVDKIAGGKAELVRANGDEIRVVTWEAIAEESE